MRLYFLKKLAVICLIFFASSLTFNADAKETQFAIVSLAGDSEIVVFELDDDSGELTEACRIMKENDKPGAMCFNAEKRCLYVAMKESGTLAAFRIGPTGKLNYLGNAEIDAAASYLSVHPSGKFLMSSYYAAGQIAVHEIKADGSLKTKPLQIIKTDERAHAIAMDPNGKFAFVPHTRPNKIFQFVIETETGVLKSNDPPTLVRKQNTGPRHLWFHPSGEFVFGSDEQGSSITSYCLDPKTGSLAVVETLPSLPSQSFEVKKSTSDIEVHPSSKFVYIANRGVDLIAAFSIDQATGRLTLIQHIETEKSTRSFNVSPDGKFLIATGQKSGKLTTYRIEDDGRLTRLKTIDAGKTPWWVLIVPIEPVEIDK